MIFQTGKEELKTRRFWIEVCCEFLVTLLYLFLACGAGLPWNNSPPPTIHMAACSGLSVTTLVMAALHVSGGHLNPAVSVAFMAAGRISILKALLFVAAQSVGAICGAAIIYGLTPQESIGSLGATVPSNNITTGQAFGVELVLTFMLMFAVFAVTDPDRGFSGYGVPLAIGICVFICLIVGIPSSGAGLNPARSFGPAVVTNNWRDHWVYWLAPIVGGLLGTFTYQLVFAEKRVNQGAEQNNNTDAELPEKGFKNPQFEAEMSRL